MKLRECSAKKLLKIAKKKKIICFGAGGHLQYFFNAYSSMELEQHIRFIVDNDTDKIGKKISVNGYEVKVCSPEELRTVDFKKHIVLITTLRVNEIFAQVQNITGNAKGSCYKTPDKKYSASSLVKNIMCRLPLKNVIVFKGEGDTCDNTMALFNYIRNDKFLRYKLVQLCEHPERFIDTKNEKNIYLKADMNAVNIKELIRYYYYVGRAKYIIYENMHIRKLRSDQILVYLNHGSPPIKSTKGIINLPSDLNYAVCPSEWSLPIYCEQYSINKERVLICGSPRTDILFRDKRNDKANIYIKKSEYSKIILWTPTFRQRKNTNRIDTNMEYELGVPIVHNINELEQLEEILKRKNVLLLLKLHKIQDIQYIKAKESEHFRILTQDDLENQSLNVYDIMQLADGMLTDYSTIAFDYMLIDRPIGYTLDDIEEYKLGFSVSNVYELMPGRKIFKLDEMIEFINDVCEGVDLHKVERNSVNRKVHDYLDGQNCQRICEMLGIR